MAAGPLFVVVEKNVKPSHGTQEKGLKRTEIYTKRGYLFTISQFRVVFWCMGKQYLVFETLRNVGLCVLLYVREMPKKTPV